MYLHVYKHVVSLHSVTCKTDRLFQVIFMTQSDVNLDVVCW